MSLREKAELFGSLHVPGRPLVLANAWDVGSAVVAARAGAPAVATTSAGVAWSLGYADGDNIPRDVALEVVARVAAAVDVPVTADIERGFGATAAEVGQTVKGVLEAGAVGINLEDSVFDGSTPLRPVAEAAERVAAAREAAGDVPLFINARTDVFLAGLNDLDDALARAAAYLEAGASGVFVPGTVDLAVVRSLTSGIAGPVNILVGHGSPTVAELAAAGAGRLSLGSDVALAAYRAVELATTELLEQGTYDAVRDTVGYGDMQSLLG